MDFQKFKEFLTEKMFLFCNWDEEEWNQQYVDYKQTLSSYNPEYIAKLDENQLLYDYAREYFSLLRRDTHTASLKEEFLPTFNYSVFYALHEETVEEMETIHELVKAPDRVTAIEKVILSSYPNPKVKEFRKKWLSNLNGSCFEDIQKELTSEGIIISVFNIDKLLK